MAELRQEHCIILRCPNPKCGYECKEISGETKQAYNDAKFANIRILQRPQ